MRSLFFGGPIGNVLFNKLKTFGSSIMTTWFFFFRIKEVIQLNISKNLRLNEVLIPYATMVRFLQSGLDVDGDGG